ncbi:hypothetical protein [Oleiagrimonas sp. MCCC 1A03011]|uniref:hypothetical protein n=1 Tax=Oleiagrimonas sp. MCCC 1A03011 TaxID=1926883 RepID=UPI000DC5199D|nr:hypothetical protein [Oleiagrimonas sp. MCCC 1A03011]RAP59656.1 hypothetical protein BTJ49_03165 [Oleiagrimonas sp. MCCC 1A03011]
MASIIVIAIAVVVSVVTYGALAETAGVWAAGAIAGAASSAASQLAGDTLGISHGFSFKQVLVGAVGGAIGGGLASEFSAEGSVFASTTGNGVNFAGNAIIGAATYGSTYEADKLMNMPAHFSWAGFVSSAVGSGVGGEIGPSSDQAKNIWSTDTLLERAGSSLAQDVTTREVSLGLGDSHVQSWQQIGEDVFGNTLGSAIGSDINKRIARKKQDELNRSLEKLKNNENKLMDESMVDVQKSIDAGLSKGLNDFWKNYDAVANDKLNAAIDGYVESRINEGVDRQINASWISYEGRASKAAGVVTMPISNSEVVPIGFDLASAGRGVDGNLLSLNPQNRLLLSDGLYGRGYIDDSSRFIRGRYVPGGDFSGWNKLENSIQATGTLVDFGNILAEYKNIDTSLFVGMGLGRSARGGDFFSSLWFTSGKTGGLVAPDPTWEFGFGSAAKEASASGKSWGFLTDLEGVGRTLGYAGLAAETIDTVRKPTVSNAGHLGFSAALMYGAEVVGGAAIAPVALLDIFMENHRASNGQTGWIANYLDMRDAQQKLYDYNPTLYNHMHNLPTKL